MLQRKACSAAPVFWRHLVGKEQVLHCSRRPPRCCFPSTACPTVSSGRYHYVGYKWAVYNSIKDLPEKCEHSTMNRKLYFSNRLTGNCIKTISSASKRFIKAQKVHYKIMRSFLNSYPVQFMWKKLFKQDSLYRFC